MVAFALFTLVASAATPPVFGPALEDAEPVHLGIALRVREARQAELDQLLADLQDPQSPSYHRWLTPREFGERFGLPLDDYERIVSLLASHGFTVTRYPSRLFLEAMGSSAKVRDLLGVQLRSAEAKGQLFRSFEGVLQIPEELAPDLLKIAGLDTRNRHRHHIDTTYQGQVSQALGPDDLRLEYDMNPLMAGGQAAAGLTLAVLGTAEGTTPASCANSQNPPNGKAPWISPSDAGIEAYFALENATVIYKPIELPNTNDYDTCGSNTEYQLDVEMQSVAAGNAKEIDFVAAPSSEVFVTGAAYIVNSLPNAIAVSTSLGDCESEEEDNGGGPTTTGSEAATMRQTVQQGVAEGQTWFAAAGDSGADDCADEDSDTGNGFNGGEATVDFPGSMPEIVCMGGTQFAGNANWDSAGNLAAFEPETTWNEGEEGGAGGGGQSLFYAKPSWQMGVGPEASDGARDVPDLALEASTGTPGTAVYDCGAGQDSYCQGETTGPGTLDVLGGTSFAGPLAAGITALLAGQIGCTAGLGDIHTELYTLGQGSQASTVFHDITTGNNTFPDPNNVTISGFTAGPGYDLATGWGSVDVAQLAAAWPSCTGGTLGGNSSGGAISNGGSSGGLGAGSSSSGGVGGSSSGGANNGGSTGSPGSSTGAAGNSSGGDTGGGGGFLPPTVPPTPVPASGCSCATHGVGDSSIFGALVWLGLALLRRRARSA